MLYQPVGQLQADQDAAQGHGVIFMLFFSFSFFRQCQHTFTWLGHVPQKKEKKRIHLFQLG